MKPGQLSTLRMVFAVVVVMMMVMRVFSVPHPSPVHLSHGNQVHFNQTIKEESLDLLNVWNSSTNETGHRVLLARLGCMLPTCAAANLISSMQGGDEKAGSAATDPFGNGKK
ncbi:uncharacterized protein zgc:193726 [Betta splendens]|uniref:Uncharacterized protein zgc:193726 n=1 Tax=Betta splendens TaxID=158456 RepID=A0A8M1HI15_BETSP|nr:uncharacterized protein zgc:193726 [Betta splendens]